MLWEILTESTLVVPCTMSTKQSLLLAPSKAWQWLRGRCQAVLLLTEASSLVDGQDHGELQEKAGVADTSLQHRTAVTG